MKKKTSVVSKEYKDLNTKITHLQKNWKDQLQADQIKAKVDHQQLKQDIPVIATTHIDFDIPLFVKWIKEVGELLVQTDEGLDGDIAKISELMTEDTASRWVDEALSLNHYYFLGFAEEHGVGEWLPQFLAEHAVRPYLQLTAEVVNDQLKGADHGHGCPVCGEPSRLGYLEKDGMKFMNCPRCHARWQDKRLHCHHCGNDNHDTMKYLKIEGEMSNMQIHVCEECNGYTKLVDVRERIENPDPTSMDLETIHLDFVAQQHGYSATGSKKQTS